MKDALMADMFDRIAGRYDFLNRFLSMRRDVYWRKRVVRSLPKTKGLSVLYVATGTADLAICSCMNAQQVERVSGVDVSKQMLA